MTLTNMPFQVLSWAAVALRLYTRFRIVRAPGWDDLFIFLALVRIFALAAHASSVLSLGFKY